MTNSTTQLTDFQRALPFYWVALAQHAGQKVKLGGEDWEFFFQREGFCGFSRVNAFDREIFLYATPEHEIENAVPVELTDEDANDSKHLETIHGLPKSFAAYVESVNAVYTDYKNERAAKIREATSALIKSLHDLNEQFTIEDSEIIAENFPFARSLDEIVLDVATWADTINAKFKA